MVKKQLLDTIALVRPCFPEYRADAAAAAAAAERTGCIVLRLPRYHSEFNPAKLIWTQIKNPSS